MQTNQDKELESLIDSTLRRGVKYKHRNREYKKYQTGGKQCG